MDNQLFTLIYSQKKKKINISIDADLKAKLKKQKSIDGISTSERIEALYRIYGKLVEDFSVPAYQRCRGERGKPMFGNAVRQTIGIFLTPDAIAFFDKQAERRNSDRLHR